MAELIIVPRNLVDMPSVIFLQANQLIMDLGLFVWFPEKGGHRPIKLSATTLYNLGTTIRDADAMDR